MDKMDLICILYTYVCVCVCVFGITYLYMLLLFTCLVMSDSLRPPWTAACQASLSLTNSQSLLKFMSIELVMPSNHLILYCPLLLAPSIFASIRVFPNESVLHIRWPTIGVSASASLLPVNIQDWFPLGWTGWISLLSRGLSRVFSNTTVHISILKQWLP